MRVPIIRPSTRGEAHRAGDAAASGDGTQAGAIAEMGDDQAGLRQRRIDLFQPWHDEIVGQAVEAVAAHAGRREIARQGEVLGQRRLGAMERGVEAGDLRHGWAPPRR